MKTKTEPTNTLRDSALRDKVLASVESYVETNELVPPLSMEELEWHAKAVIDIHHIDSEFSDFVMVLINNEVWNKTISSIPYERRLLLLPKCLRSLKDCPAEMDEYGLMCEECGRCPIGSLQNMAEELGYVVLIAEGSTVVTKLLEGGKVDAVIGVSCMEALEKSFPHMAADAIPGIAVPLLYDGCENTRVNTSWVEKAILLKSDKKWFGKVDFNNLRDEVRTWFETNELERFIPNSGSEAEEIALNWLRKDGKRWRPLLAVCVYKTITECGEIIPDCLQRLAIAVECFHKASLVHDDIEDNSHYRYGDDTLHHAHGVPIALNAGDLLLGWGYHLISDCDCSDEIKAGILAVAASGHRDLCLGQGAELSWTKTRASLEVETVLNIFRNKTAPAFNVALAFGARAANADMKLLNILEEFSESLGIAFQIKDDIEDFLAEGDDSDLASLTPSIIIALACEHAQGADRKIISRMLSSSHTNPDIIRELANRLSLIDKAQQLGAHYKNEAIRTLIPLRNAPLKTLLRRLVSKILS